MARTRGQGGHMGQQQTRGGGCGRGRGNVPQAAPQPEPQQTRGKRRGSGRSNAPQAAPQLEPQQTRGRGRGRGRGNAPQAVPQPEPSVNEVVNPPALHPLLTSQAKHRLQALINGDPIPSLKVRHGHNTVRWNARYEPYVRSAGFFGIHQISSWFWDDDIICAMVERWRPETHTFHLPVGELTITLEDVAVLLGLPIHGTPVCGATQQDWAKVVPSSLGTYPEGRAMTSKSAVSLPWLREKFDQLDENATERQVEQHARAYILSVLGGFLMCDLSGDSVPCIYLPLLHDLNQVKSYAWGAAVLGRLYRELCRASAITGKQIGGCLPLLQFWICERIPAFQPKALSRLVSSGLAPDTMPPRGFYWSNQHKCLENKHTLVRYRELIDGLQDDNVEWMPNSEEVLQSLPPNCFIHSNWYLSKASLIDFAIVETYHPERVMRQFGKY